MLAKAIERTGNRKVGAASVTMTSQVTCPSSCPFLHSGCYAESGLQGIHTAKLNKARGTALQAAREEAIAIGTLSATRPLRLHVVGDCVGDTAARIVSRAAIAYKVRHGQPVWTYTHAWAVTERSAWGTVSVLASVETTEHADRAERLGYASALTVPSLPADGKAWREHGRTFIPCPEQTGRAKDCTSCRLCFSDSALRLRSATIVFGAHGAGARKVATKCQTLNGSTS